MGWFENVVYHQMAILVWKLNANQWIFGYPIFGQTHICMLVIKPIKCGLYGMWMDIYADFIKLWWCNEWITQTIFIGYKVVPPR